MALHCALCQSDYIRIIIAISNLSFNIRKLWIVLISKPQIQKDNKNTHTCVWCLLVLNACFLHGDLMGEQKGRRLGSGRGKQREDKEIKNGYIEERHYQEQVFQLFLYVFTGLEQLEKSCLLLFQRGAVAPIVRHQ